MRPIVQFTGLSGVGKTTLAALASEKLIASSYKSSLAALETDLASLVSDNAVSEQYKETVRI